MWASRRVNAATNGEGGASNGVEDDEDEIPLEMEDIEAVSKKARQDDDLNTEHLQVCE